MRTKRQPLTDEQRAERRAQERERMQNAIEELRSSDGWQTWLATRSRFHRYSLGNQLLIASQHPDARRVAGFHKWLELGYHVRKGEHGIYIYAPCPPSKKQIQEAQQKGEEPPRTFFRMVAVFAQDQIEALEGAEQAPLEPPHRELEGDSLEPVWGPLVKLAATIGSEVSVDWTGQAGGYYEPATRRIVISDQAASVNARVRTLVHEIAHALVRADRQDDDPQLTYAQEELVVESVAYSVTGTLGLDASGSSIPYLTSWSTNTDLEVLERTAKLINRLASRIEDAIPEEVTAC